MISVFYFTYKHVWNWNQIIWAAERILTLCVGKYSWAVPLSDCLNNFRQVSTCWKKYFRRTSPKAEIIFETRQPALISQRRSPTPHFLEVGSQRGGLWPPNSNSADIFVQCTYPLQVSSSYVYSFGNYRVDKQTDAAENIQRSSLPYDVVG